MSTNRHAFQTTEFAAWAEAEGLAVEEAFLVDRFLEKEAPTLEAGVGGGRVLQALHRRGFRELAGFDVLPEMVARARQRAGPFDLRVLDAQRLTYSNEVFEQALYLGQVLCFIEDAGARRQAVEEAYRVLREGGTAIFSFLVLEARSGHPAFQVLFAYLKALRTLKGQPRSIQYQPWLRRGGGPNLAALLDRPPYAYWFTVPEAVALLREAGFTVRQVGTSTGLRAGLLHAPDGEWPSLRPADKCYVVCRK